MNTKTLRRVVAAKLVDRESEWGDPYQELVGIDEEGEEVCSFGRDCGESEDNSFDRDWSWVPTVVNALLREIATLRKMSDSPMSEDDFREYAIDACGDKLRELFELQAEPVEATHVVWDGNFEIVYADGAVMSQYEFITGSPTQCIMCGLEEWFGDNDRKLDHSLGELVIYKHQVMP